MPDLLPVPPPLGWRARLEVLLKQRPLRPSRIVAAAVIAGVTLAGIGVAAVWVLRTPPPSESLIPQVTSVAGVAPVATDSGGTLVVQAAGAVMSPGVYRVRADARVVDVIDAAGGLAPGADPDRLELASKITDG